MFEEDSDQAFFRIDPEHRAERAVVSKASGCREGKVVDGIACQSPAKALNDICESLSAFLWPYFGISFNKSAASLASRVWRR